MKNRRKLLRNILIFAWMGGFLVVGQWIFGAYYGPICSRYAQQVGWEYESFSVGGRRGGPSCTFRVPEGDGQSHLDRVAWRHIPRSIGERLLVVLPFVAGILYFMPLIWLVAAITPSEK